MVKYTYDSWGKCKVLDVNGNEIADATHIGNRNPFRYRSYYYDVNTGLYYLKSRFYDPETGRFLNADTIDYLEPDTVNGLNLYAYCGNNPVMCSDPSGHFPWLILGIIAGALILAGGAWGGVSAGVSGGTTGEVFAGIGKGMLSGAMLAGSMFLVAGAFAVPGGISSILGLTMFTSGVTIPLDMLEIAGYQGHKSSYEGRSFWDSANDINNALFSNAGRILLGSTSIGGIAVVGSYAASHLSVLSEFHDAYLLAKTSYKSSIALSMAFKDTFLKKITLLSAIFAGVSIYEQIVEAASAIFGDPNTNDGKWILY